MVKSPSGEYIVAGSQSNKLFLYNMKALQLQAKIEDVFQDTISAILFISDYKFYVVDMTGLLVYYTIDEQFGLVENNRLELCCIASNISAIKTHLFVTSEDDQFIVINRKENYVENQQNVQGCNNVYPIDKNKVIVAGNTSYLYQIDQFSFINSQNIQLDQKVCESYFYNSVEKKILFVGTDQGVVIAYQLDKNLTKLQQIEQLALESTSPVTLISSIKIYGQIYYLISNNEELYVYQDNLQLRCCIKLNLRGLTSIIQYNFNNKKYKDINQEQLILASTTDGDVLLIDVLNGILIDEMECIDEDDQDKTYAVTQMFEVNSDSFAITGDKNIYIYSKLFVEPQAASDDEKQEDIIV